MKRLYKILTVFMSVIILFYSVLANSIVVHAEVPDDAFYMNSQRDCFSMVDTSSIPSGKHFFFKYDDGKCWYTTYANIIAYMLNSKFGVSVNTGILSALVSDYDTFYENFDDTNGIRPLRVANYDSNNGVTLFGYALNDLNGCRIVNPSGSSNNVTVPSDTTNYTYIYVKDYLDTNYSSPDFITYVGFTPQEAKNLIDISKTYAANKIATIEANNTKFGSFLWYNQSSRTYDLNTNGAYDNNGYYDIGQNKLFYARVNYDTVCNAFGLTTQHNSISAAEVATFANSSGDIYLQMSCNNVAESNNDVSQTKYDSTYVTPTTSSGAYQLRPFIVRGSTDRFISFYSEPITIYKDNTVATQIKNHTYSPSYNTTNTYNTYDSTSNSNETNFNTNNVDNSEQNNTTIYNEQSENYTDNSYYNSENNYYIDNSQVTENNTTIINNYYGDNGGGSGGDDDDDDDDLIWTALLKAIADFFKKLGELIATVLTGIVEILTSILTAIGTIVTDFTGITDFLGQIFAWLPSEIITLMTLGLTTALFAAFLTWFKK